MLRVLLSAFLCSMPLSLYAQGTVTLPPHTLAAPAEPALPAQPSDPPERVIKDGLTHLSFTLPAGWNLSRNDGELSTFHLDARTAPHTARLALVADIAYNPYPRSTFSGALFYLSLTPRSTAAECLAQASSKPATPAGTVLVGDTTFQRGSDAHGKICTEARDTIYTALRHGSCVRFDLAINSFCGGEASGALDLTESQLTKIQQALEAILNTVHFGSEPPSVRSRAK